MATLAVLLVSVAGCGLPRSGPNKREIFAGSVERQGDAFVVNVNDRVTRATSMAAPSGFTSDFVNAGVVGSDDIRPGDKLSIGIWENVDNPLLGSAAGGRQTEISQVQVDDQGYIFVPYAGRIKAAGVGGPDALRRVITAKLDPQTPDPQITVTRVAGDGGAVSVISNIGGSGLFAIERPTRTLSGMIARAGGITKDPQVVRVTVKRAGKAGTVWLKDLYDNPRNDIGLRPGDVILIEEDTRAFTALGALGGQTRAKFDAPVISALEAIAQMGGLNSSLADPKGVFVFRNEPEVIAKSVLGRTDLVGDQRMIYVLDLTKPNGIFMARDFVIRDGDTVYVTEAPFIQWQKTISSITGSLNSANSLGTSAANVVK